MVMKQNRQVNRIIFQTVKKQKILSVGILCAVVGAVVGSPDSSTHSCKND